jgi:GNAT superfamily N-acetyltransferase
MATNVLPSPILPRHEPDPARSSRAWPPGFLKRTHTSVVDSNDTSGAARRVTGQRQPATYGEQPAGGVIRKLWFGDSALYRDHLLRLDRQSRHARFAGTVSDQFVHDHANVAISTADVIHGFFVDGVLRGAAELQPVPSGSDDDAEVSFSVERPWQDQGAGSALLARTLVVARNRGICRLQMACLAGNRRMQQLARKFHAELTFDSGSVIGEIAAPEPTPMSMVREFVADAHGFATAILDVQVALLRSWATLASEGTMRFPATVRGGASAASAACQGRVSTSP